MPGILNDEIAHGRHGKTQNEEDDIARESTN